ncbi:MAG: hypothetical protein IKF97_06855 [Clostridia bacterium]|nr:hypothetical protein [Clostridia bacterium]
MSETMIICTIVGIILLILVIASKTMDILVGLLGTVAGIGGYIWLGSTDSYLTQLKWAFEFGVAPSELKTYCLVLVGISIVILIIGLIRGKKTEKVVIVKQQVPVQPQANPTPVATEPVKPVEPVKATKNTKTTKTTKTTKASKPAKTEASATEEVKSEEKEDKKEE